MPLPDVASVKLRLNKTTTVDDAELQDKLTAAIGEYEEWVGPTSGPRTQRFSGGGTQIILPRNVTAVTAVSYTDGTVVPLAGLDFDPKTGILGWGYGTAGRFPAGIRNVIVTFSVDLPINHRETIAADVAGYFAATQRGGSRGALPGSGYEAAYEERSTPVVLFPRIRALAVPGVA